MDKTAAAAPAPAATEAVAVPTIERGNPDFIEHMHNHADYLDDLNLALEEGDIVGAMTPAYWLSRHDSVEGVPEDWQPYIEAMHAAAMEVEQATNIDAAKAAAGNIAAQCRACHAAAGVAVE
jgi:cytochrome c556